MLGNERIGQLFQITVHDEIQLVQRQVDAVVRHAALREIVGADALAAVARADQTLAGGGFLGLGLAQLHVLDAGGQHLHGLGLVLVLRAVVLALDHDAGRQVGDADGGIGLVDVLAAGAAGPVGVDAQVGRVDVDRKSVV